MILAVLGQGILPFDTPVIRADDEGFLRGDACFDTARVTVNGGTATVGQLDEHLSRFARSAERLGLPPVDTHAFAELAREAAAAYARAGGGIGSGDGGAQDGTLKFVWSRGSGETGPVGFVTVVPVSAAATATREGVTCAALTNGQVTGVYEDAPWLLAGVKSASYAQRMAALREAKGRGCDEVLFVSADGFALDGPTSGLLWRNDDDLATTDVAAGGVLRSQTVEHIFDGARGAGHGCREDLVTLDELLAADGAWLASSSRGVVPILGIRRASDAEVEPMRHDAEWNARVAGWAGF